MACCASCAKGGTCEGRRGRARSGAMSARVVSMRYGMRDALTQGAGVAAAGACAGEFGPESAPICGTVGAKLADAFESAASTLFGDSGCEGWPCVQAPPADLMADLVAVRGQAFGDRVQAALVAWLATPEGQILTGPQNQIGLNIPAGSMAQAYVSKFIETVRDAFAQAADQQAAAANAAAWQAGATEAQQKAHQAALYGIAVESAPATDADLFPVGRYVVVGAAALVGGGLGVYAAHVATRPGRTMRRNMALGGAAGAVAGVALLGLVAALQQGK